MQKATHNGELNIGDKKLSCAVLEDGSRIISRTAVFKAFGRTQRGRKKGENRVLEIPNLPSFIDANNLLPYIDDELKKHLFNPISYTIRDGKRIYEGYRAEIIPLLCDVYLKARQHDNVLTVQQEKLAFESEILVRSLAKLGIVALVDEATGYQADREKEALQKILNNYILEELRPWIKRFPDEFYKEMFRLKNWDYPTLSGHRPGIVGKYTNQFVYNYLPLGVKEALQEKNPINEKGNRSHKHHQYLTPDYGIKHLEKHLIKVVTLMQLSETWEDFESQFNKLFEVNNQMKLF